MATMPRTWQWTKETRTSVLRLLVLAALMAMGHACKGTFRFVNVPLDALFSCIYWSISFFAVRPLRRLREPYRTLGWIVLIPVLLLSSVNLIVYAFKAAGRSSEIIEPQQIVQQGRSTIELGQYDYGGAVGVHGIYLEQRRLIFPDLYLVRSIDFYDDARNATLSIEAPDKVRVHAQGSYHDRNLLIDKVYMLKEWVYF